MPSTVEFGALPHAMQIFCQKCTADTAIPAHGCGGGSNGARRLRFCVCLCQEK